MKAGPQAAALPSTPASNRRQRTAECESIYTGATSEALDKIEELVKDEAGFEVQKTSRRLRVGLPCSPLSLIFEETPGDDVFMALRCSCPAGLQRRSYRPT